MRVSKMIGSILLVAAVQTVFSANVYECRHNGKTSYSQTPGKDCTNAGLGRDRVYSSVRPCRERQGGRRRSWRLFGHGEGRSRPKSERECTERRFGCRHQTALIETESTITVLNNRI